MDSRLNSRGFTLVELLATLAILAIIVVISFVSINGVIKQNDVKNCESLVNNIKSAAREYVSDKRYDNSFVNSVGAGMKISLSAEQLINNKNLSENIQNPFDDSVGSTGDVVIDVQLNDNYSANNVDVYVNVVLDDGTSVRKVFSCNFNDW